MRRPLLTALVVMLLAVTTPVFFSLAERAELKGVFKGAWASPVTREVNWLSTSRPGFASG